MLNGFVSFMARSLPACVASAFPLAAPPAQASAATIIATKELHKIGGTPISSVLGASTAIYTEPRNRGLRLTYRFGS